jgi:ribosomal protein L12E/L44/L45/RPP1/RPP2
MNLPRRSGAGGIDFKNQKIKRMTSKFKEEDIEELIREESSRSPASGNKKPSQE